MTRAPQVSVEYSREIPSAHDGARWMGVNLLAELDAPGEYYLDPATELVYVVAESWPRAHSSDSITLHLRTNSLAVTVNGAFPLNTVSKKCLLHIFTP